MKTIIHSPAATIRRTGNRQTSNEWARFLREAGHDVLVTGSYRDEKADLLIALHALKSREAVVQFTKRNPHGKTILALTGTDIYPEPTAKALETMSYADALITLQNEAIHQVAVELHDRVATVVQSARKLANRATPHDGVFQIAVVGHLRDVKDPLLTAKAVSALPNDFVVQVCQAGGILDETYAELVAQEEAQNPRYRWLGELSEEETAQLMADSDLLVVSSRSEGGARVVGEAIVHGTPVLSTAIDGVIGLLGPGYPGYFPVGDADSLSELLQRCLTEPEFYAHLCASAEERRPIFSPASECKALLRCVAQVLGG